jgi:fatty acid desaturase
MYFMFFPLGHSDNLYSQYFAEDYFYSTGEHLNDKQIKSVRFRIMAIAAVSMFFSTVFAPVFVGFIGAIFVDQKVFYDFIFLLLFMKIVLLCVSLYFFFQTSVGRVVAVRFVVVMLYITYVTVVFVFLADTYDWTIETLRNNTVIQTVRLAASDLVYNQVWAYIVVPAVSAAVGLFIAREDVRAENLPVSDVNE